MAFFSSNTEGAFMGIPIAFDKPFKSYEEQIVYLRDNYGLIIDDENMAKYILSTFSYYDIINGYQECMMYNGKFKDGITMMYLYLFHVFDKEFQNILFKKILLLENSFKTKLAYFISEHYGVSIYDYLDKANYKPGYKGKISFTQLKINILRDIGKIDKQYNLVACTAQPCKHYFEKHHHIPPWILMKNISFDNAITLYLLLKPSIKAEVTNSLIEGDISLNDKMSFLTSALTLIRKFRNTIAHNLKFVTYSQKQSKLPYKTTLSLINESTATEGIINFDDIYGCLIAIFILLKDPKEQVSLLNDLQKLLTANPLGIKELQPLTKHIVYNYLEITNLGQNFPNHITGLTLSCIKKSSISEQKKSTFIELCNMVIS